MNAINHRSVTLTGSTTLDGSRQGAPYNDPFGSWNDVIVTGTFAIPLE